MGCFSGNVSRVANTRIFARATNRGTQIIVYQMEYTAGSDVALILPLPTPPDIAPDAVRFPSLSGYPDLFADIDKGFPLTRNAPTTKQATHVMTHEVGSFEASFVPTQKQLDALDARFRIPLNVWNQLPEYSEFGFAVFKLRAGTNTVQPLAVEFPTRNPQLLYFPTLDLRNDQVTEEANFDHDLFCQARAGWLRSYDVAGAFVDIPRAQELLDAGERISRMTVQGIHPNSDILVGLKT